MEAKEAAAVIDSMIKSLKESPGQFNIEVNVTGLLVNASKGSTGLIVSAVGGGPGSTTTGMNASISSPQIDISQKRGTDVMNSQMQLLIDSLSTLSNELKSTKPEKGKIKTILQSLKESWVPHLIINVLSIVLTNSVGI